MDKIVIAGGLPLQGEVLVSGAKNSALPILASTILGGGECVISNVPRVVDVVTMGKLLDILGADVQHDSGGNLRPRLFLPSGNPSNPFARAVDLGDWGGPWQWIVR